MGGGGAGGAAAGACSAATRAVFVLTAAEISVERKVAAPSVPSCPQAFVRAMDIATDPTSNSGTTPIPPDLIILIMVIFPPKLCSETSGFVNCYNCMFGNAAANFYRCMECRGYEGFCEWRRLSGFSRRENGTTDTRFPSSHVLDAQNHSN